MMEHLTQFSLLAQGADTGDWTNLLFIAVMAILWLVAALIKAISKKQPQQEQSKPQGSLGQRPRPGESWQQRLARKAEEIQRRLEEEAGLREPGEERPSARETATRPTQGPGGDISVRPGQPVRISERPGPQTSTGREHQVARQREAQRAVAAAGRPATAPMVEPVRRATPEPMMEDLSSIMAEPPEPLKPGEVQQDSSRDSGGFEPVAVIDYSDPDALKKAILHYEILGKPLALRDESAQVSAF